MVDRFLPEPPRPGAGLALGLAAIAVFGLLWFQVLTGERTLIATDTLYTVLPWSAEYGARTPANRLLGDEMLEIVPWQQQVAAAFRSGRLPLWNQHAGFGSPLLANGASAPFSPFTWAALPFEPVRGLSLAMLLKLLVAGLGMAAYQRALGGGGLAAAANLVGVCLRVARQLSDSGPTRRPHSLRQVTSYRKRGTNRPVRGTERRGCTHPG